jgi:GNAT superfamily N-acetyltransferase
MLFREAHLTDIPAIQVVRNAVKENVLSNPALVSDKDCEDYMFRRGKGWVCDNDGVIVGFAIADLADDNIWALFVHPDHEKKGIGRKLHTMMLKWYFEQGKQKVWLSTAPASRAARFYRLAGWRETGFTNSGELKFEMSAQDWMNTRPIS